VNRFAVHSLSLLAAFSSALSAPHLPSGTNPLASAAPNGRGPLAPTVFDRAALEFRETERLPLDAKIKSPSNVGALFNADASCNEAGRLFLIPRKSAKTDSSTP